MNIAKSSINTVTEDVLGDLELENKLQYVILNIHI